MTIKSRPVLVILLFGMQILANHVTASGVATEPVAITSREVSDRALLKAAAAGRLADVQQLLKQGADASAIAQDRNRRSVLILAAAGGHSDTVKALLSNGADVDYRDKAGLAALNWAALRRRNHVAALLLQGHADVNTRDNNGVTPLLYAVGTDNLELLKLFAVEGAELDVVSEANLMTPLLVAVEAGNEEAMLTLLELGANIDGTNHLGYTPLMAAAEAGKVKFVQLLLAGGADRNARDIKENTASAYAQKNGYTQLEQLLNSNPDS